MSEVRNEYFSSVFTVEKNIKTGECGIGNGGILRTIHIIVEEVL